VRAGEADTSKRAAFCSGCGGALVERSSHPDQRTRPVCERCGSIAYRNPRVLVSTLVAVSEQILLCRRAIEPAVGLWAPPGGFLECGEALEEAAARETFEETGIHLDPRQLRLHAVSTLPDIGEVYVGFLAQITDLPDIACGPECSEVRFFREGTVPWGGLAYPDIGNYLHRHFEECRRGEPVIHFSRLDADAVIDSAYRVVCVEETKRIRASRSSGEKSCPSI
jgi:ADP-ribose pyrophosphatase YjhB (NUDIX family)